MQKPRLFLFVGHAFFGWGFGGRRVPGRKSMLLHGTRCRFWHCSGFFYLAVALQHVSNIFNITPESALHAPVVASASRWVPRPPLTSECRDPQRPRALRGPIPPCPATGKLSQFIFCSNYRPHIFIHVIIFHFHHRQCGIRLPA